MHRSLARGKPARLRKRAGDVHGGVRSRDTDRKCVRHRERAGNGAGNVRERERPPARPPARMPAAAALGHGPEVCAAEGTSRRTELPAEVA